jgi:flagellar hook-associated protein 2
MATDSLLPGVLGSLYGLNGISSNIGLLGVLGALSVPAPAPAPVSTQVSLSGLGQLQSASDSFESALQQLLLTGGSTSSQLSNANPTVLAATALATAAQGSYQVDVTGLAQSQALQSTVYATPDSTVIGTGTLTLQLGQYDATSNSFTTGGTAPVSVSIGTGTLNDVASSINAAGAGVIATVVHGNGGYQLVLSSASTGAAQGFEVQADNAGLAALAYDPTNPGAGGLVLKQGARDATLSVNGASQSSASNLSVALAPGLSANLLQAGSTTLTVAPDSSGLLSQAQGLASAFNALQTSLNTLQSGSGPEVDVAQLYSESLQLAGFGSYSNGTSALTTLGQIGLGYQASAGAGGATLALDAAGFNAALAADPSGTASLLSQAEQTLSTIASTYGDPGGIIGSTQSAYQATFYIDQLLQGSTTPSAPTTQDLVINQFASGPLSATQIAGLQQYATAILPLQQDSFNATLLGDLYGSGSGGALLSATA